MAYLLTFFINKIYHFVCCTHVYFIQQGEAKRRAPGAQRFTAYLGRVPPNVNENVIRYIFSQCGNILDIRWQQDKVSGAFKG